MEAKPIEGEKQSHQQGETSKVSAFVGNKAIEEEKWR